MRELRKEITEVVEAVFKHGMHTPNWSRDLPKGQMTIVDAVNRLDRLMKRPKLTKIQKLFIFLGKIFYHPKDEVECCDPDRGETNY